MRISVRVIPRARRRAVDRAPDGTFVVKVAEPAEGGRANAAVIEALAEQFNVPKRSVSILRGARSRRKLVEVHQIVQLS